MLLADVDNINKLYYKCTSSCRNSTEGKQELDECTALHTQGKMSDGCVSFLAGMSHKGRLTGMHLICVQDSTELSITFRGFDETNIPCCKAKRTEINVRRHPVQTSCPENVSKTPSTSLCLLNRSVDEQLRRAGN